MIARLNDPSHRKHFPMTWSFGRVVVLLALIATAPGTRSISVFAADKAVDPGADLFGNGTVLQLKVEISREELKALKADNRQYARCTVTEGAVAYADVGIRLKGAAGSFRELGDKPALTLSFNRFNPGQRFHGLRKIHLNNSVQDPSYLTELICGQMFEEAGVPAARTAHARVTLNRQDQGFYVLKEGFTRELLGRFFTNTSGNLYDGGFLTDITDLKGDESEGQSSNPAELRALADAAQEGDPQVRWDKLNRVLDVDRFISFMAMEVLTWHWDGYTMKKNNYRLYHDPSTGKVVFLAHGMDQMFEESQGPLVPYMQGMVADAVIQTPIGRERYLKRLGTLFTNSFNPRVLTNRVNEIYAKIHPAIVAISRGEGRNHEEAVNRLRERIVERHEGIRDQLAPRGQGTLSFDEHGTAIPGNWEGRDGNDRIQLNQTTDPNNKALLHIGATESCRASWRTRVRLDPGRYRFEGRVRSRSVDAISDDKGEGAGLRISGRDRAGGNKLNGTSNWKTLVFPFEVNTPGVPVELVCELRANKGEVWFDTESLRLVRESR